MKQSLLVLAIISLFSLSNAQQYTEPTYQQWSEAFKKGDIDAALSEMRNNLVSDQPNDLAMYSWVISQNLKGSLEEAVNGLPENLKSKAKMYADIVHFEKERMERETYEKYSIEQLTTNGGVTIDYLWADLIENIAAEKSYQLTCAALEQYGEYFRTLWTIDFLCRNHLPIFYQVKNDLEAEKFDAYPNVKSFLEKATKEPYQKNLDHLAYVNDFLKVYPNDAMALRFKGHMLNNQLMYVKAVEAYLQAWEIDPFYQNGINLESAIKSLMKANELTKAQEHLTKYVSIYHRDNQELEFSLQWSEMLVHAGMYGEARDNLKMLEGKYIDSPRYQLVMGKLEKASSRNSFAIKHLEQAYKTGSKTLAYYTPLIDTYRDNENYAEALEILDRFAQSRQLPEDYYYKKADIFEDSEEYNEAYDVRKKSVEKFPNSSWHWSNYAYACSKINSPEEALKAIQKTAELKTPTSWVGHRLYDYTKATKGEATAMQELKRYAQEHPWNKSLWSIYTSKLHNDQEKEEIYLSVIQDDNAFYYTYDDLIYYYHERQKWEEALALIEQGKEKLNSSPHDLKELAYDETVTIRQKGKKEHLSLEEVERAIRANQKYAQLGGEKDEYWYRDMAVLHHHKDDMVSVGQYLDTGMVAFPDSEILISNIRNSYLSTYGSGKLSRALWGYVERNPYDINRYKTAIGFNVKWGGSPITAIVLSQQAKEKMPDNYSKVRSLEVMAYGKLGDNAKDFEIRYGKENAISTSERYINWYNTSRHNAWKGSNIVDVDVESSTATIQFPDGTIAQRQDDPATGKVTKLQVGDAYIKAQYTFDGHLKRLSTSSGKNIILDYNDAGQIIGMTSNQGEKLTFDYNEFGKPKVIHVRGVGKLETTYDEYGNVDTVITFDEEGNEAGTQLAMKVTNSFQELLSLAQSLQNARTLTNAQLPDIGIVDTKYEQLQSELWFYEDDLSNPKIQKQYFEKAIEFARYLKDHTHVNPNYASECIQTVNSAIEQFKYNKNKKTLAYPTQFIDILHDVLQKSRRNGLAEDAWESWINTLDWLEMEKQGETKLTNYRKSIEQLQQKIQNEPIQLLASAEWLPKSMLQNEGYWKKYSLNKIVKKQYQDGLEVNAIFKRNNGDILLGTNKGLVVRHDGYWDHFAYNSLKKEMQRDIAADKIKASSSILSITEDDLGKLYLGTADGLIILSSADGYLGKIDRRLSSLDGLSSASIDHISKVGDRVYLGSDKGVSYVNVVDYSIHTLSEVSGKVNNMKTVMTYEGAVEGHYEEDEYYDESDEEYYEEDEYYSDDNLMTYQEYNQQLMISTSEGLWVSSPDSVELFQQQISTPVNDAIMDDQGQIFALQGKKIVSAYQNESFTELYGNYISSDADQVYGLAYVKVGEGVFEGVSYQESAPTVLTDLGLSLYFNHHYEHFYLPLRGDGYLQARLHASNDDGMAIFTGNDVLVFEKDQAQMPLPSKVDDIVSVDELGITIIASEYGLYYTLHNDPQSSVNLIDYYSTSSIVVDDQNRIIVNDGAQVYRLTWNADNYVFDSEELFYANQYEPEDDSRWRSGPVKSMLIAQDGTLWVATSLSVFRYRDLEGSEPNIEEYNYFRSSDKFPAPSYMIYRILETPDGKIWCVSSDEGHLYYNSIALSGGLLLWNDKEEKFEVQKTEGNYKQRGFNWFMTSVTPIDKDKAIIGTLGGFAEYNHGAIKDYYDQGGGHKNSSYDAIYEKRPSLFMGTRGDNIGDLWLFGCASGVVAYRNGVWFYPDRINQMLPEDIDYGNYGSRLVNAIATDPNGKIYIGTDLGLLIYDSQGADPMSFLINSGKVGDAFAVQNEMQLQQERSSIIKSIPKSSSSGKIITELEDIDEEINRLQELKASQQENIMSTVKDSHTINTDSLTTLIQNKQKKHFELLLKLEKQDPAIHQLLDVKPVEMASLRKNLRDGECLVQYIPTRQKLYIQVLSKDAFELREAMVPRDSLMKVSMYISNAIKYKLDMNAITPKLEWLYDILLRPIENDIAAYDNIMIIPVQALNYIPFGSLVDNVNSNKSTYALQKYNIAYVSSTYLLGLLMQTNAIATDRMLLMGNPDGSLPGAEQEVKAIGDMIASKDVFVKKQATYQNLIDHASGAKIVHMATHGYLDGKSPEKSAILLADQKLTLPKVFNLPLDKTEMIVLSACETGKGADDGLEYATIARAFANAGAPTVLATLWKVDDQATQELMTDFYSSLDNEPSKLQALTSAQRKYIADHPDQAHPYYWAAFVMMGRP